MTGSDKGLSLSRFFRDSGQGFKLCSLEYDQICSADHTAGIGLLAQGWWVRFATTHSRVDLHLPLLLFSCPAQPWPQELRDLPGNAQAAVRGPVKDGRPPGEESVTVCAISSSTA